jgi:ABC-2 type transport system permease protein
VIAYAVFAVFAACVELFAQPGVAPALLAAPDVFAQLIFTPLLAGWSIWLGIAISTRVSEIRVAQQLGLLANLPSVAATTLVAVNLIHPTLALAIGGAALLLVLNRVGWRIAAALFDRERLILGTH